MACNKYVVNRPKFLYKIEGSKVLIGAPGRLTSLEPPLISVNTFLASTKNISHFQKRRENDRGIRNDVTGYFGYF